MRFSEKVFIWGNHTEKMESCKCLTYPEAWYFIVFSVSQEWCLFLLGIVVTERNRWFLCGFLCGSGRLPVRCELPVQNITGSGPGRRMNGMICGAGNDFFEEDFPEGWFAVMKFLNLQQGRERIESHNEMKRPDSGLIESMQFCGFLPHSLIHNDGA